MNCNYKVKITDIQNKYQFKIFCAGATNSINVNDIYNLLPTTTTEGDIFSIANTSDIKAKSISIKGNTSQASTPTPTNPVDVKVVTGTNTVKIMNKNIFNKNDSSVIFNGFVNGSTSKLVSNANARTICLHCKANTTYTISKIISGRFVTAETTSSTIAGDISVTVNSQTTSTTSHTITTSASAKYILVFYYLSSADTLSEETIRNSIQIEDGSTATTYVEHQEKNYIINLGTLELCKIGTYQDYLYKNNNKWYKHNAIKKIVLNGTEDWSFVNLTDKKRSYIAVSDIITSISDSNVAPILSSHFEAKSYSSQAVNSITARNNNAQINIFHNLADNNTNFKSWLSTNNVTVYYGLSNATDTEITNTTLIKQLNYITDNARTYEGATNIDTITDNEKPIISITTFNKLS